MIAYPEKLPPPVRENFTSKYAARFTRLKMDDGGRRSISEWTAQPREFQLRWNLTWDQLALFEAWFKYDVNRGAEYVNVPIQNGIDTEVIFTDDPNISYNESAGHWEVTVPAQTILAAPTIPVEPADAPSWPSSLPLIEKEGYGYVKEGAIHPSVKDGYQDGRMRWRTARSDVKFTLKLSPAEKDIFEDFVHNTLIAGRAYFYIQLAAGAGVEMCKAQLSEPPVVSSMGAWFQVSGVLDTFTLPEWTEFEYRYPDGLQIDETLNLSDEVAFGRIVIANDTFTFTESLAKSATISQVDGVAFSEDVSYIVLYARNIADALAFVDSVATEMKYARGLADIMAFSETGSVITQDYFAEDYVAEDYVANIVSNF